MDKAQRKAMIEAWKNRSPEMGVIALRCKETGESFLGVSKNIPAEFNQEAERPVEAVRGGRV